MLNQCNTQIQQINYILDSLQLTELCSKQCLHLLQYLSQNRNLHFSGVSVSFFFQLQRHCFSFSVWFFQNSFLRTVLFCCQFLERQGKACWYHIFIDTIAFLYILQENDLKILFLVSVFFFICTPRKADCRLFLSYREQYNYFLHTPHYCVHTKYRRSCYPEQNRGDQNKSR